MAMDWEPTSYGSPVNGIYKLVEIDGNEAVEWEADLSWSKADFFAAFKERRLKQTDWD